ncbi:MAG: hypothetical protein KJP23_13010, partial [Deltaproteobacteria bacterium]|nr:hypothetical protein [Deltaproteobacteria bacterium]
MLDKIQTEVYEWYFRHYGDMVICSVNVIDQKPTQVVSIIPFDHPKMSGNVFSITPILLRF